MVSKRWPLGSAERNMAEELRAEKPLAIAMVICEKVITEEGTGNKTIVSTFNTVTARRYPTLRQRMSVYAALTNASGAKKVELRLRATHNDEVVLKMGGSVQFDNPNHVIELVFNLKNLPLPQPGMYAFELVADEEYVSEIRFNAIEELTEAE
jgi:hypothetical protein